MADGLDIRQGALPEVRTYGTVFILTGLLQPFLALLLANFVLGDPLLSGLNELDAFVILTSLVPYVVLTVVAHRGVKKYGLIEDDPTRRRELFKVSVAVRYSLTLIVAFGLLLYTGVFTSTSSTAGIAIVFYVPYSIVLLGGGYFLGRTVAKFQAGFYELGRAGAVKVVNIIFSALLVVAFIKLSDYGRFSMPDDLGVTKGDTLFTRSAFADLDSGLCHLSEIRAVDCREEGSEILVAGHGGVEFFDGDGRSRAFTGFSHKGWGRVTSIRPHEGGECWYVGSPSGRSSVGLYNQRGEVLWEYGEGEYGEVDEDHRKGSSLIEAGAPPVGVVPFDYGGDGTVEFLIHLSKLDGDPTHLVDIEGRLIRSFDFDVKGAITLDMDGDGIEEFLYIEHRGGNGEVVIRNAGLDEVDRIEVGMLAGDQLRVVMEPRSSGSVGSGIDSRGHRLLIPGARRMSVLDLESKNFTNFYKGPLSAHDRALYVFFKEGMPPYLAVLNSYNDRQYLRIYDDSESLVYEEVLSEGSGMGLLPAGSGGGDVLLLGTSQEGCKGKLFKYSMR